MQRLLLTLALGCATVAAALPVEQQRERFQTLLEAAQSGELHEQPRLLASLEDYPLYPYLLAADLTWQLRHNAGPQLDRDIQDFLDRHPQLPASETLRHRWIRNLAKREMWQRVRQLTQPGDGSALQCHAAYAGLLFDGGKPAIERVLELWHVGHSQSEECDPAFAWLEERGHLGERVIQRRAHLAVLNKQYGLARYLARKLSGSKAQTVERWIRLSRNPGDLHHAKQLDPEIAVHVIQRLALQDLDAASELLPKLIQRLQLNGEQTHEARRYIALLYAQNLRPEAPLWFERLDEARLDDFAREWRIRSALYNRRWALALHWIETLPANQVNDEEWRYWRARSLGALDRQQAAEQAYQALAQKRSYHGYLAADQLGQPYSLNEKPLERNPEIRARLLNNVAIQRARELHALDMNNHAGAQWRVATNDMRTPQLQQAALLAHDWGWHARAITTLARSGYWDDLDVRYPLTYRALAREYAHENNLDPALVLSIMRTESLFVADARSPAGAYGLMQLLPGTARQVARGLNAKRPSTTDLKTPKLNVRLGSRYLSDMLERFGGNLSLAMAAYNAGPHRVERWLPEQQMPADLWVANIPYTETRKYVQRAMSHMTVFQSRLDGDIVPLRRRMAKVEPTPGEARS